MRTNQNRDLAVDKITKDNYVVPKGEEHIYHVKQETKQFNKDSGEKLSRPRIQKYGVKSWSVAESNLKKQKMSFEILHDPTVYLADQTKATQTKAEQAAANAEQAKAEAKAKEKNALKAEIMEELKAAGVIPVNNGGSNEQAKAEAKAKETGKTEGKKTEEQAGK